MKRSWIVIAAVVVAVALAIVLLARRGGPPQGDASGAVTLESRVYQNDSLGVRLRIPESPGWSLVQDVPGNPEGRLATANHGDGTATVRVVARPATDETTVDGVFAARQRQIASTFGLETLEPLIAQVLQSEEREVGGRRFRQWQAISNPIEAPGDEPSRVVFMWLVTATPRYSLECLGLVRFAATASATDQEAADALLRDVAYILQSFEVR